MELQPNPLSAMELVANEPIRLIDGRKAVCDGGKSTQSCEPRTESLDDRETFFSRSLFFFCRCWTTWSSQDLH